MSLDNLEYSYHDETMVELGLTPSEVELTIPSFVLRDRAEEIEYWSDQMKMAMQKLGMAEATVCNIFEKAAMPFPCNGCFVMLIYPNILQ